MVQENEMSIAQLKHSLQDKEQQLQVITAGSCMNAHARTDF